MPPLVHRSNNTALTSASRPIVLYAVLLSLRVGHLSSGWPSTTPSTNACTKHHAYADIRVTPDGSSTNPCWKLRSRLDLSPTPSRSRFNCPASAYGHPSSCQTENMVVVGSIMNSRACRCGADAKSDSRVRCQALITYSVDCRLLRPTSKPVSIITQ